MGFSYRLVCAHRARSNAYLELFDFFGHSGPVICRLAGVDLSKQVVNARVLDLKRAERVLQVLESMVTATRRRCGRCDRIHSLLMRQLLALSLARCGVLLTGCTLRGLLAGCGLLLLAKGTGNTRWQLIGKA